MHIIENATNLSQENLQFFVSKIIDMPIESIGEPELKALAGNSKFRDSAQLRELISDLFWRVLCSLDGSNVELIQACIEQYHRFYREAWAMDTLEARLEDFHAILRKPDSSATLPLIRLFTKILRNQKIKASIAGARSAGGSDQRDLQTMLGELKNRKYTRKALIDNLHAYVTQENRMHNQRVPKE